MRRVPRGASMGGEAVVVVVVVMVASYRRVGGKVMLLQVQEAFLQRMVTTETTTTRRTRHQATITTFVNNIVPDKIVHFFQAYTDQTDSHDTRTNTFRPTQENKT